MEFSTGEMKRRLETVRGKMQASGVDCLMITGVENFNYFTGVPVELHQTRRPMCAIIPVEKDPVAVGIQGLDMAIRRGGIFQNFEAYRQPVSENLPPVVTKIIKDFGARRVGCELGEEQRLGIPLRDFEAIKTNLPDNQFVDATDILWSMRMFKSKEEIERMKKACEITSQTRQELFRQVRKGMTEGDVADLWAKLMYEAGAERPSFIYINTGKFEGLLPKPERKLQKGDALWVDGGVYIGGYTCDFNREATLGESSSRQREIHRDVVEVCRLMMEKARPGVTVSEIWNVYEMEMRHRGYSVPYVRPHGHGMGMLINEPPQIAPWVDTILFEGLLLGLEPGTPPGMREVEGMLGTEQLLHIKEDGYDLLTTETDDLIEIPW